VAALSFEPLNRIEPKKRPYIRRSDDAQTGKEVNLKACRFAGICGEKTTCYA
jgi:hypothetical protein